MIFLYLIYGKKYNIQIINFTQQVKKQSYQGIH